MKLYRLGSESCIYPEGFKFAFVPPFLELEGHGAFVCDQDSYDLAPTVRIRAWDLNRRFSGLQVSSSPRLGLCMFADDYTEAAAPAARDVLVDVLQL